MIGTLITIALIGTIVGVAVFGSWHQFVDFLKDVYEEVKKIVSKVVAGVKCFLKKAWDTTTEIVKSFFYDKERDQWSVRTTERDIPPEDVESEVPEDIRANIQRNQYREHDVTDRVELKLRESV